MTTQIIDVDKTRETRRAIAGLSLFAGIRSAQVVALFDNLIATAGNRNASSWELVKAWTEFIAAYVHDVGALSFADYWARAALQDENDYTIACEHGDNIPSLMRLLAQDDFSRLAAIGAFDVAAVGDDIAQRVKFMGDAGLNKAGERVALEARCFADATDAVGPVALARKAIANGDTTTFGALCAKNGAGILAASPFFYWVRGAGLKPALNRDTIKLDELTGYEEQRAIVRDNTLRFLDGCAEVNNILLYGDRGTGKSATVKAVCNSFAGRGLRLIELRKRDADDLPCLLETLAGRGLRFVVFIDDLSFEAQNDSFNALKALLEGSIEKRPSNVVIYATSNRRHLVKEPASDRPTLAAAAASAQSGDMRAFDTMQEQLSLADRFGLTVVFTAPSQETYLKIAVFLAQRAGVLKAGATPEARATFRDNALRWERWFNGRSPRTARQFVNYLAGGDRFPWE
jgi:predicted AAA+ superfamily ATPase